ncbi:LOW QUALITY PROTEIN: hypothetical protein YC2023_078779 [Brassica napus]
MIGSPNNGRPPNENFCLGMELKDLIIKPDRDCIEDRGTLQRLHRGSGNGIATETASRMDTKSVIGNKIITQLSGYKMN